MNKTIITATSIIAFVLLVISYLYITSQEKIEFQKSQERIEFQKSQERIALKTETRDRFTVCIDTIMVRSKENGKPVSATEAKNICSQVEKV